MSDSKSGSKTNLNESNMPLLDDDQNEKAGETPEKEQIELEEKDDSNEKEDKKKDKKKKEKKEKKPKKEKGPPGPSCIDTLSEGLNLENRDMNAMNTDIDLDFDDVLAEPSSTHGVDAIWKLAFIVFSNTKLWLYRIMSAVLAVPLALVWGVLFSLLTVLYVWICAPALRIFDLFVNVFRRVLIGVMRATVEPVCVALGAVFSQMNVNQRRNIVQEA